MTADAVIDARRMKAPNQRKAAASRYRIARADAVRALELADVLVERYNIAADNPVLVGGVQDHHRAGSHPKDVVYGALAVTVVGLTSFAVGAFYASAAPMKTSTQPKAHASMDAFEQGTGMRVPWALLADTVSAVTGKVVTAYSIRRLRTKGSLRAPGLGIWKAHELLVERLFKHADEPLAAAWRTVISAYLRTP